MIWHACRTDLSVGVDLLEGQTHLHSRVNARVCGASFIMLEREDQVVKFADVSPFWIIVKLQKMSSWKSCATAWINPEDRQANVLVIHQPFHFGRKPDSSLSCPNLTVACNGKRQIQAAHIQKSLQQRNLPACCGSMDEVIINHMTQKQESFEGSI